MFGTQLGASNGHEPLLGRSQRVLLEVCTVLYFFAKNSAIPLVQQYIYYLVAKKYNYSSKMDETLPELIMNVTNKHVNDSILMPNASSYLHVDDQGHLVPPANSTLAPEEKETNDLISIAHKVNEESSLIVLYLNVAELFPAVFMVLVLGCWSDMTGKRKFLMWLPCLGNAVYALGFLLPIYISGGDIDHPATKVLFVLASLISGLSGSVPGYLSGNASYISDTDSPRRRTLRLAIVEFSIGTTFGLANLINGFWVDLTNHFEQPLWFVVLCSLIPFVVLCFLLREPHGELSSQLGQPSEASHVWRDFRGVLHVFGCKTLPQKKLWAVFFAFQVYVFVQQGQERTFVLFLQNFPLYWQPLQTGIFLFILYTLAGLGSWPGIPLLQRIMDDASIAILAMISKLLGSLLLAFAEVDPLVYLASVVQMFHLTPYAVSRSLASLQAGEDEQGSVFALIHSVQSVMGFFGPVVHNLVFAASLQTMGGLVFILSGPLLLIPIALLMYMKYLDHLDEGYMGLDGNQAPPLGATPASSATPLSETSSFAQRPSSDFGTTQEGYQ